MASGRALEEGARSVWGAGAGDAEDESARRLERLLSLGVSLSGEDASALPAIVFFSLARLYGSERRDIVSPVAAHGVCWLLDFTCSGTTPAGQATDEVSDRYVRKTRGGEREKNWRAKGRVEGRAGRAPNDGRRTDM